MIERLLTVALVLTFIPCAGWTGDAPAGPLPPATPMHAKPAAFHSGLSPLLNQLYDAFHRRSDPSLRAGLDHLVVEGRSVEVVIVSRPNQAASAADRARLLGGEVKATYRDLVFATVPIARLPYLAVDPAVLRLRTPYRSRPDVLSEGVRVHGADVLHGQGIGGEFVKIGVIDCNGFSGYQPLIGNDLPVILTLWGGGSDPVGPGDHGTACAEIVHDMAPGAEMYLAHDGGELEFYLAVDWMIAQGVRVISYSCGWLGAFPGDGAGDPHNPVNQKVTEARAAGVLFVTSSGNRASASHHASGGNYQGWFEPFTGSNWHTFDGEASNPWYVWQGKENYVALTWNDWPADPLLQGSTQDYDMDLWMWDGSTWTILASSENPQNGLPGQLPFEEFSHSPPASEWYAIVIRAVATTEPHFLSLRTFKLALGYFRPESSCSTPETPDGLLVGAAFWKGLELECFSSRGPTLGPGGTPDGGYLAPHILGADGVSTVTNGPSDGAPYPDGGGFFGTSAACPHVAGGAALLLSENPSLTVDDLRALLIASAQDMGPAGPDNEYGHGWMDLSGSTFVDGFESGDTSAWSASVP